MKYVYPAIFTPEQEGGYGVVVPDLPGCGTCGETIVDAIEMARDAISIPQSRNISEYHVSSGFVNLIDVNTAEYRRVNESRAVKKTLTIPSWLNVRAEKAGINFSQVLQNALRDQLSIE